MPTNINELKKFPNSKPMVMTSCYLKNQKKYRKTTVSNKKQKYPTLDKIKIIKV
jgi:hypothetical protein